jgi:hypothetical protein
MVKWYAPEPFKAFTEEQRQAYQNICRKWPAPIDWNEALRQLEQACREHSVVETAREAKRRSAEYNKALNGAEGAVRHLTTWLGRLNEMEPADVQGLPDVRIIEHRLLDLRKQYEEWTAPFPGRKNRIRETFDNQLLAIWEEQFHGRIRSSKGAAATPIGPLVRFLSLTYKIALGKWAPGPSGIRYVINQAKKRKRGYSPKRKSAKRNLRQRKVS